MTRIVFEGLSESLNAGIMGFMFLSLTAMVTAYGCARADRAVPDVSPRDE